MESHIDLIVTLLTLYGIAQKGDALKCYSCDTDQDCNDEFVSTAEGVDVLDTDECKYCIKTKTILESLCGHRVRRSCHYNYDSYSIDNIGCITCTSKDEGESCKSTSITCYCDEDNCYHGNRILTSWISLLLAVVGNMVLVQVWINDGGF